MQCAGCLDCSFDVAKPVANFYEAHITVDHDDGNGFAEDLFEADCSELGVKPLVMVGGGLYQVMSTVKINDGIEIAIKRAQEVADAFSGRGYVVQRVKVEAHPASPVTPSRANSLKLGEGQYFEAHIDVSTHEGGLEALKAVAKLNGLYLSYNDLKVPDQDGYRTYIATLRNRMGTIEGFRVLVESAARHMRMRGLEVVRIVEEFCVYDSNESLDHSWTSKSK